MTRRPVAARPARGRGGPSSPPAAASVASRRRVWPAVGLILLASGIALAAFRLWPASAGRPASPADGPPATVVLPPMEALSPAVREQIIAAHREAEAQADAPAAQRAAAWGSLGQVLLAYGLDAAELALRNAAVSDPAAYRWPYYLGRFYQLRSDIPSARAAYEAALALSPDDIPTRLRLAQLDLDAGEPQAATAWLEVVLARDPDNAYAHFLNGEVATALGDDRTAVVEYSRALELQPSATRLHYLLAMAERRLGRLEEAAAQLARRGDVPVRLVDPLAAELDDLRQSSQVLVQQAGVAEREGRLDDAMKLLERAVALDPRDGAARQNLGLLRYRSDDLPAALSDLEAAVAIEPGNARFHLSLAVIHEAAGRRDLAEAALQDALRLDPQDVDVHIGLADFYRRGDRCGEAGPHLASAIGLAPARSLLRVQQAVCRVRVGESRAALDGLRAAQVDFPRDASITDALARVLAAAPDAADRDSEAALSLVEPLAREARAGIDVLETMAMALAAAGRFPEAIGFQERALAAAEDRPAWRAALAENLERYRRGETAAAPWPDFLYQPEP